MDELYHHGIRGQKWGVKNGPPYPLKGGNYSRTEKYYKYRKSIKSNTLNNKRHIDKDIKEGTALTTLSYDRNRLKNADYSFATYKNFDKHRYKSWFNTPVKDLNNKAEYKYAINYYAKKNLKIASEDSSVKVFRDLYEKDRDFFNYVTDPNRMQSNFVKSKLGFKGYREANDALERIRKPGQKVSDKDLRLVYRMYNYTIPSDGGGNVKKAHDVAIQRNKFFKELKNQGYSGLLDTNDAIYGKFKADAPVIVFDMNQFVFDKEIGRVSLKQKRFSDLAAVGARVLRL